MTNTQKAQKVVYSTLKTLAAEWRLKAAQMEQELALQNPRALSPTVLEYEAIAQVFAESAEALYATKDS